MPPKIPEVIICESNEAWEHELHLVGDGLALEESEETWDRVTSAIQRLTALTKGSAADFPQDFVAAVRPHVRPINSALNSERSRLSGAATDLIISLATQLGRDFGPLLPHFGPTLLGLASRSNKLFISRAKSSLLTIAEHSQLPNLLPQLRESVNSKSLSQRLVSAETALKCLNCYDPSVFEVNARAEEVEFVIRATARDASADVRKISKKLFEAYKVLLPQRVNGFIDPLTPVMRKYLDIKSKDTAFIASSSSMQANLKKSSYASSTSTSSVPVTCPPTRAATRLHGHTKSSTVGSQPIMQDIVVGPSTTMTEKRSTTPSEGLKTQRPTGSGPMRPPPHLRHAIRPNPEPARPGLNKFPSRPASAQSTESNISIPPPELTTTRERAKRPPKLVEVPPPSKGDAPKPSYVEKHDKGLAGVSKRPETTLSRSGGFMVTSGKSIGGSTANKGALRVKRTVKDSKASKAEDNGMRAQRPAKLPQTKGNEKVNEPEVMTGKAASAGNEPTEDIRPEKSRKSPTGNASEPLQTASSQSTSLASTKSIAISVPVIATEGSVGSNEFSTKPKVRSGAPQKGPHPKVIMKTEQLDKSAPQVGNSRPPSRARPGIYAPTLSQLAKKRNLPKTIDNEQKKASKKTRSAVEPLAIHKVKMQPTKKQDEDEPFLSVPAASEPASLDLRGLAAAEVPLPESPPPTTLQSLDDRLPTIQLDIPPLPTPLRDVNATKYRMAATPISALLFSIERGFDDSILEGNEEFSNSQPQDLLRPSVVVHTAVGL